MAICFIEIGEHFAKSSQGCPLPVRGRFSRRFLARHLDVTGLLYHGSVGVQLQRVCVDLIGKRHDYLVSELRSKCN